MAEFQIEQTRWQDNEAALRMIRETVFMREQRVPEELEWDGLDGNALHLLARDRRGNPIATARMLEDGHIGRVAVLSPWRGRGIGRALMQRLLQIASERSLLTVHLDAQAEAAPFYQRLGFSACGELFMDAGIPHRHMHLTL
jgi:predicted GNAT family N-acyltransferase